MPRVLTFEELEALLKGLEKIGFAPLRPSGPRELPPPLARKKAPSSRGWRQAPLPGQGRPGAGKKAP
jgi:hypothetical protein